MRLHLKPTGIDHVALNVHDVERMTAFYRDILGCAEEKRQDGVGLVHLRAGAVLIDLVDRNGPLGSHATGVEQNLNHLCLRMADFDADAARAALVAGGVEVNEVRERYGSDGNARTLYLRDPEGNGSSSAAPRETALRRRSPEGPSVTVVAASHETKVGRLSHRPRLDAV